MDGALRARSDVSNLFVDPRLLGSTSESMPPDKASYTGVPPELDRAFHSLLNAREIPTESAFEWRPRCSGALVSPEYKVLDSCPSEPTLVLAFGLPRPGENTAWEVPMSSNGYSPGGSTGTLYSVEVDMIGDRLEYVREVPILFID